VGNNGKWTINNVMMITFSDLYASSQTDKNDSVIGSDVKLKLFCWVLNVSDDPFHVIIGNSLTVSELKKEIKKVKEHTFGAIDPDTLGLWKVGESSLRGSMSSNFREAVSTHSFCGNRHEA
jgi:hypothetical protein